MPNRSLTHSLQILLLLILATVASAQQAPPPGAVEQVSPSDYALLEADLAAGMSLPDGINVDSRSMALGYTDADGNFVRQDSSVMTILERIAIALEGPNPGAVSLYVAILDSPERAIGLARQHFGDYGMNPDWMVNANELGDPRIAADGGSVTGPGRAIIRYRNVVADFNWQGGLTTAVAIDQQPGHVKTLEVARLWMNKVAGPPGADLSVHPNRILVKHSSDSPLREREPAADRQYVIAQVNNRSADVAARGVQARLSVQMPGADEYTPVQIVNLGTIAPGASAVATFEWDLRGESVTNAGVLVDTWADGPRDTNPRDNQAGLEVSVYYAHNGDSAYRWREDSYGFRNYSYSDEDFAETVKALMATIVGEMYTDPKAGELLSRMFFPQTYMRLLDYLHHSSRTGAGGHCYGMSATAGLYFLDASLRPGGGTTSRLSRDAADANIKIYQRAQMVPIAQALLHGDNWFARNWDSITCLNTVRKKLRDERRPVILSLSGTQQVQQQVTVNGQTQTQQVQKGWGHAVMAYKLVEETGQRSVIYVYDPNLPPSEQWDEDTPMSAFHIDPDTGSWLPSSDMLAIYHSGNSTLTGIAAREVTREVSVAEANALVPDLKAKLREMSKFLENANRVMAVLSCPAEVVFTDAQGRRVGEINGVPINEVPGAQIRASGEVEIYLLPSGQTYSVSITGTGAGVASFDMIRPENGEPALTSFRDIPVSARSSVEGTLKPKGAIESFSGGGATYGPTLVGSLAGDRVTWQEPPAPQPAPTPTPAPTPAPTAAPVAVPNLSGEWAINANNSRSTLTLQHDGNRLTGTVFSVPLSEGAVLGDGTVKFIRTGVNQSYTGTFSVDPDGTWKLSGTFDCPVTRTTGNRWVATRTSAGAPAPQPTSAPPQPAPAPAPTPAATGGDVVICRDVVNGQPVGAATFFDDAAKVALFYRYEGQAAGTAQAVWLRDGAELTRSQRQIEAGNGWVSFSVMGGGGQSLPSGRYEVILTLPGRPALRGNFTIGGGGVG